MTDDSLETVRNTVLKVTEQRGGPLARGGYRLSAVSIADRRQYIHSVLQEVHRAGISFREAKGLKKSLAARLLSYPRAAAELAVRTTHEELIERPAIVAEAIRQVAFKDTGRDPGPILIRAEPLPFEGDFQVWTSVEDQTGVDSEKADHLVRRGLLTAAGLNQRIHLMERFGAVTGFQDAEVPLFQSKLSILADAIDPQAQERRFDRVLSITDLPDLHHLAPGVDVDKLLELRDQPESREFRAWLRTVDDESDEEIAARFADLRARAAEMLQSRSGRAVRFLVSGIVGLAGFLPGAATSAVDTFLVDRLLGRPGPAAFIGRRYPSIFREDPPGG